MEIILTSDIPNLGYKGDILTVKPGYARNYLIPQKLALIANEANKKIMAENEKQAAHKIAKMKEEATNLANKLNANPIRITAKAGASGKIFGSITTLQIAQVLSLEGYEIDRRKISLKSEIKEVGNFVAIIDLHKEVKAEVNLEVVAE
jgi:large subunit ribosomal protein L9